jgi:hypothetical protein
MTSGLLTRIGTCAVAALCGTAALETPPAEAGAYHVRSCFADGVERVWSTYRSNGFADAYRQCPHGLIARNVATSTPATPFSHAKLYVSAPPGTWIEAIHFDGSIATARGWAAGLYDREHGRWLWCGGSCHTFGHWFTYNLGGFATSTLEALIICAAAQCPSDGTRVASLEMRNITLRLQDAWIPNISIVGGSLASGGWKRGVQTVEVHGEDNTGVRSLRVLVDGALHDERPMHCDDHSLIPCPAGSQRTLAVDLSKVPNGLHTIEVQAIDAGGNVGRVHRSVTVDNSPPDPVLDLSTSGPPWSATNSFDLAWTNPSDRAGAPISGVNYRFCAEGTHDNASCRATAYVRKPLATSLARVAVPGPGAWRLQLWLVDEAGNQNHQTAREVTLRWDPEAPLVRMLARDENEPARIRVDASDAISGLAATEIELRRYGTTTWHSLTVERTERGFTAVIDDEAFPRGKYSVRARARDLAGNERSTEIAPMSVTLPIRLETDLAVGRSRVVRADLRNRRRVLIRKPRARYGRPITLTGRLLSPSGNPLVQRDVEVFERLKLPGSTWRPIATVRTGNNGRFRFKARPGPNRLLRFRYAGTPTIQGATSIVVLRIRATSGIRVSRRNVVNGDDVIFRGRVKGQPIPPTGKLLQLQVYSRGHWLTFATPRANVRGRWRYRYRFTATRGVTRYRFRVRIPREAGYPFVAGTSRTVGVKVTGL